MTPPVLIRTIRQNRLILPVYLPTILIALTWGIREPVLPLYVREFGASYGLVGLSLSGQAVGMLLTDVPSGVAIRRLGQKGAMIAGLMVVSVMAVALSWARSIPEVIVYRVLAGAGFSIFGVARHTYIAEQVVVGNRGRAVALFGGLNRIGRFSGPLIGGLVADVLGFRASFLLMGALYILALVVVVLFVPAYKSQANSESLKFTDYLRQIGATIQSHYRIFTTIGAGQLFAQMVRSGPKVIIPLYAADVLGLNITSIGAVIAIGAAIDMTLFYPTGVVMDRLGRKFAILPSFAIQGLGLALIPLAGSQTGLALVAALIGFGNGLGSGTMMTLGADLAPPATRSEFLGIWRLIGDTGFTIGPLVAGAVAGAFALPTAALVMAASGLTATAIFAFLVPETRKR